MGPKAPWRGRDGQIIKNIDEDAVGVYIVEAIIVEKMAKQKKLGK